MLLGRTAKRFIHPEEVPAGYPAPLVPTSTVVQPAARDLWPDGQSPAAGERKKAPPAGWQTGPWRPCGQPGALAPAADRLAVAGHLVLAIGLDAVAAAAAVDDVALAVARVDEVVAAAGADRVAADAGGDAVVAAAPLDRVVSGAAEDLVLAAAAGHLVHAAAAPDLVSARA